MPCSAAVWPCRQKKAGSSSPVLTSLMKPMRPSFYFEEVEFDALPQSLRRSPRCGSSILLRNRAGASGSCGFGIRMDMSLKSGDAESRLPAVSGPGYDDRSDRSEDGCAGQSGERLPSLKSARRSVQGNRYSPFPAEGENIRRSICFNLTSESGLKVQ